MEEKTYKDMGGSGALGMTLGIISIVFGIVSGIQERKLLPEGGLQAMRLPVRWTIYYALIFAVIIFGAYGVGYQQVDLIYAGF